MDEADRPYCQDSYTSCDQTQKIYPATRPTSESGKWKYCICSIAVALVATLVTIYLMDEYAFQESLEYSWFKENGALDSEVLSLFVSYDTNMDGKLDKNEFVPIANRILNRKVCNGQYLLCWVHVRPLPSFGWHSRILKKFRILGVKIILDQKEVGGSFETIHFFLVCL